jgi:hypothetical protein
MDQECGDFFRLGETEEKWAIFAREPKLQTASPRPKDDGSILNERTSLLQVPALRLTLANILSNLIIIPLVAS